MDLAHSQQMREKFQRSLFKLLTNTLTTLPLAEIPPALRQFSHPNAYYTITDNQDGTYLLSYNTTVFAYSLQWQRSQR